jgi:hypothetical protein
MGVLSIEVPWGLQKTMFEVGLGAMTSTATGLYVPAYGSQQLGGTVTSHLTYLVLDTQTCLLDFSLGAGFSALGCLRVAAGSFHVSQAQESNGGGALWFGVGGRLRWQSPQSLYFEAELGADYGTVSGGEDTRPGWGNAAASVGFQL